MSTLDPLVEPIVTSTTCIHRTPGQMGYGRVDNPTRLALERELAQLENARFALAFSSGSAALAAVFSLLKTGETVLAHEQVYEGTSRMLQDIFKGFGILHSIANFADNTILRTNIDKAKLMICESITNPCLVRLDLNKIVQVKGKKTILVVDNTVATPIFEHPLEKGADIVVHSLTKYIAGHHEVIAGAIMTNNLKLFKQLRHIQWTLGAIPGPFDCSLVLRGMQTLKIRMLTHQKNGQNVSGFLAKNPRVEKAIFPGISGMVSFWIQGDRKKTIVFLMRLKHIRIAHSFGGIQTTVLHPLSMMTWTALQKELEKQGITGNLVRMSVGIEDPEIIISDLSQALGD